MGERSGVGRSAVVVGLLATSLVAGACSHVVDPGGRPGSIGSYPAPAMTARFAVLDGRVVEVTPRGSTIVIEQLVAGRLRRLGSHRAGGPILGLELVSDRDQVWLATTVCHGPLRTGEEEEPCVDGAGVEIGTLSADGTARRIARLPAHRPGPGAGTRLSAGPFVFREGVLVEVGDVATAVTRRLVLDGDRLRPLVGDDGAGAMCATSRDLFRVRQTPDMATFRYAGMGVDRWNGTAWTDTGLRVDESTVYGLELVCTRTEAVVLEKRSGGADVVTIRSDDPPRPRPELGFADASNVADNRGDRTIPTFWSSGAPPGPHAGRQRTTRIGPTGLVEVIAWPNAHGRAHGRLVFVVGDGGRGVIVGTERKGRLRVRHDA